MSTGNAHNEFYENILKPRRDADAYIAQLGGRPQITAAAEGLTEVLNQTRQEILDADFASRFQDTPSDLLRQHLESGTFTIQTRMAVDEEGEKGLKRQELLSSHARVEHEIATALSHLVDLRAHLIVSQTEF